MDFKNCFCLLAESYHTIYQSVLLWFILY